ncbi:hypothetical protein KEH51_12345 [[Brevibacterium] frigoritolerans]|uniref:Uncharacterized protein n=1 Tax=Peribacillus frigoritolerans TaxID=450367 RepID=A0A941FLB8_9BACI|nr:hypothetical protein [Peribacillus frigoritolerans]
MPRFDEAETNFKGLVIGNQGKNFCVGANIAMMLMEAQDDNVFELDTGHQPIPTGDA